MEREIQALARVIAELQVEVDRLKQEVESEKSHANQWLQMYIDIKDKFAKAEDSVYTDAYEFEGAEECD